VTGHSQGFARNHWSGERRLPRNGYAYGDFPYFLPDYETGWPQGEENPQEANRPPLVRIHDENRDREPVPPLPAQVIDIPSTSKNTETKPLPATVFVLTNGEKLETQRYLLTASGVSLTVHRDQRMIPLQMIDLDATIAANRDRGIDLRIPNDRNEVSLRF
jgi:hypothetical protein